MRHRRVEVVHRADVTVKSPATLISFTPESLVRTSMAVRSLFDRAFIGVLVRRLDAAWRQPDPVAARPAPAPFTVPEVADN